MKLSIIGTGYVGLVSGVCLAEKGHHVVCVDVDPSKVERINRGEAPFHEPGLPAMLKRNIGRRLRATTDLTEAVLESSMTFIAVGTPFDGKQIDLTFIRRVAQQIGRVLRHKKSYHVVVVKSTVVPGTTDDVVKPILEKASGKRAGRDLGVGMNPEFLSEGEAVHDFMEPDRIVIGGSDPKAIRALQSVYRPFKGAPVMRTTSKTAEAIKYTSNALLANLISFSNEIGNLCAALGDVDSLDVMEGVHLSQYLSPRQKDGRRVRAPIASFLKAGCGFGGSCLPKDVKALIAKGRRAGCDMGLLDQVIAINDAQPRRMIDLARRHHRSLRGKRVAVLGLSFKPGTDDLRESPAIRLCEVLHRAGATVRAYDPVSIPAARRSPWFPKVTYGKTLAATVRGCDIIMLVTAWDEFKRLPGLLRAARNQPVVVDGRGMLSKAKLTHYEAIGLGRKDDR